MKAVKVPHLLIEKVAAAIMVLFGMKDRDWNSFRKILNPDFLERLRYYDYGNVDPKVLKEVEKYTNQGDFNFESIYKINKSAAVLLRWVLFV